MPAAVGGLKECSKCGETKPVSEYYKNKRLRDGLHNQCKSCSRAACQRYYKINKKKIKQQQEQTNQTAVPKNAQSQNTIEEKMDTLEQKLATLMKHLGVK